MNFSKEHLQSEIVELKNFLVPFIRHPLVQIQNIPFWEWSRIILLQLLLTPAIGALKGFATQEKIFSSVLGGFFSFPILTLITMMISTLFIYYSFQIFCSETLSFRRLYLIVLLANIPFFLIQVISVLFQPLILLGLAFSTLLVITGITANFKIEKKLVIKIIGSLYLIYALIWTAGKVNSMRFDRNFESSRDEAPEVYLGR